MRRAKARVGQQDGEPLQPWWTTSPRTPLFCVVKVRDAAVAAASSAGGARRRSRRREPMNS